MCDAINLYCISQSKFWFCLAIKIADEPLIKTKILWSHTKNSPTIQTDVSYLSISQDSYVIPHHAHYPISFYLPLYLPLTPPSQIGLRGGEWKRVLLEEHFHEAAGTSYSDAHDSGFEVLPDDVVIRTFLDQADYRETIQINNLPVSYMEQDFNLMHVQIGLA